jgi:hypothetical protein
MIFDIATSGGPLLIAITLSAACSGTQTKQEAAGATFAAEQLKCVDDAKTKAEADVCREGVRKAWHVDGGAK